MRVDETKSKYHEIEHATDEFDESELRHARFLLRRLKFLEAKVRESGGLASDSGSGGGAFAEWEMAALEWVLIEIDFLIVREPGS